MIKWMNQKTIKWFWNLALVLLVAAYLLRLFVPADISELAPTAMVHASNGDVFVVSPDSKLVRIRGDGGIVPYLLREVVMDHIKAVYSFAGVTMALDREGRLWAWKDGNAYSILAGSLGLTPVLLREDVKDVAIGNSLAAVVSGDDRLWVMNSAGQFLPCMDEYAIKTCRLTGDGVYVITREGDLHWFERETALLYGKASESIANGVADVNVARDSTVQCLMEDGTVRLLSKTDRRMGAVACQQAISLCVGGVVTQAGDLLAWRVSSQSSENIVLQPQATQVAIAAGINLYVHNNGQLYWDGIAIPASTNTISPLFRNLALGWVAVKVLLCLRERRIRKHSNSSENRLGQ